MHALHTTRAAAAATRTRTGARPGLTLIEVLVVVGIIALLVSILLAVGAGVQQNARIRQTTDVLRLVDEAVQGYNDITGGLPPSFIEVPSPNPALSTDRLQNVFIPLLDGVDMTDGHANRRPINSIGLFIYEAERAGLSGIFDGIPTDWVRQDDGDVNVEDGTRLAPGGRQPELKTIVDAWGNPIRYVHPRFDGVLTADATALAAPCALYSQRGVDLFDPTQTGGLGLPFPSPKLVQIPIRDVRRNRITDNGCGGTDPADNEIGDADGGICIGNTPYVYSAGPDGDPSTTGENQNVYLARPRFEIEQ